MNDYFRAVFSSEYVHYSLLTVTLQWIYTFWPFNFILTEICKTLFHDKGRGMHFNAKYFH